MPLSLYDASVPVFLRGLTNLAAILDRGIAYAGEKGFDLCTLTEARLAPDMYPLTGQIQVASDAAKFGAARLAGVTPPSFPDTEQSFAELHERIAKTRAFLGGLAPAQFDGDDQRPITIKVRGQSLTLAAQPYLLHFVLPNFFFHVTTAYDILRYRGVPLGKMDYLGAVTSE